MIYKNNLNDNFNFLYDNYCAIDSKLRDIDTAAMEKMQHSSMTYRLIFAQNVRQVRRLKEISQEELAHLSGVSRIYIGEVERGVRNVTIDVMSRIANALEIPLEQLLIRDLTKIS